jgi:hypothetical protein
MFEQTIFFDTGTDAETEADSYRFFERHPCEGNPSASYLTKPSFKAERAVVRDVSRRGIGLIARRPANAGTVLAIRLKDTQSGMECILSAEVRRCAQQTDDTWLLGCQLSRSLSDAEMFSMLSAEKTNDLQG